MNNQGFIRSYRTNKEKTAESKTYPYTIPALQKRDEVPLSPQITFFVGENGTGKSTIVEALAISAGFNAEGGSKNFSFSTNRTESSLHETLLLVRNPRRERAGGGVFALPSACPAQQHAPADQGLFDERS